MSEPTLTQVKEAQDTFLHDWEEFKKVNDRRLSDIEKKGAADVLDEEQVARINKGLDDLEKQASGFDEAKAEIITKQEEIAKKYGERLDKIETALNRTPRGGSEPEKSERYQAFFKYMQFGASHEPNHLSNPITLDELKLLKSLKLDPDEKKALSVSNDQAAGFLAPTEYVMEIIKAVTEISAMRPLVRVRQTANKSIQIPKRTGQFAAVWVAEQGTRSETTGLQFGLEEIPTHEMYALVDISEQMLEDSAFDLESELNMEFTEQFAVLEGNAFVTGNGSAKPEGFLDNTAVASTNSGDADEVIDADGQANGLITLYHALKTQYARNATWVLNRTTLGSVRKMKDADKNYVWQPGLAGLRPNTILDAPYVEVPDMPSEAANAFPIAFGDWRRAYTVVDRVSMSVLRDPFTQATSGNIRFIARRRVGGQVVLAEAIRKLKCAA